MKKIFQLTSILALLSLVVLSCAKEEYGTDQYDSTVVALKAYGPQPVVRGGVLRFVGSNLDKVASVTIPENNVITDIQVITAGAHSEIRVTVPKETSAPGYPVLTLSDGSTITGKTKLTYSEPITIDEFAPAEAKPGDVITIKGDYFNLIHEAIFADNVKVSENDFVAHDRYTIKVKVPETAQTGKIGLGTIDESIIDDEDILATLNIVETETALVVTTAKGNLAATTLKAGANLVINGTNMNLVKSVELEGAKVTDFTATASSLSFELPATATDGEVLMVMASGVKVSAGTLTTVVPVVSGVTPAPVKNGAVVTLVGSDLDLVTELSFPKASGAEFAFAEGKITAMVPEKAQAGDIVLALANGKTVTAELTLVEPKVTGFSANPASAGSDVTLEGTDLDLVASVSFVGVSDPVEVEATATAITLQVPTAAETGKIVLNLKNKATVEVEEELAIDKPAGAYIPVMPEILYNPGDMFIVDIANPDHLIGVKVDDVDVNYILNASILYMTIPVDAKAGSQLTLVSDNGSVTYTMNIDPGTQTAWVIWEGNEDMGSWSNQPYVGEFGFLLSHPEVVPGDVIRFSIVPNADWWQIQLIGGNWGDPIAIADANNCPDGAYDIVLTQEIIDKLNALQNWGGLFVVQGENCTLTQITVIHYIPQETDIWEGSEDMGSWSNQPYVGEFGALQKYNIQEGSLARFYITPNADWWQIQLIGGNWGDPIAIADANNCPDGVYDIVLTQEIIDKLNALQNWGGLFVVQGENCTLTKISLVYLVKD